MGGWSGRDDSPEYRAWAKAVKDRARWTCQFPGCKAKKRLHAHHIRRWADCPTLRYDTLNGCALCYFHHKVVTGKEEQYAPQLLAAIGNRCQADALWIKYGGANGQ